MSMDKIIDKLNLRVLFPSGQNIEYSTYKVEDQFIFVAYKNANSYYALKIDTISSKIVEKRKITRNKYEALKRIRVKLSEIENKKQKSKIKKEKSQKSKLKKEKELRTKKAEIKEEKEVQKEKKRLEKLEKSSGRKEEYRSTASILGFDGNMLMNPITTEELKKKFGGYWIEKDFI